MTEKQDFLDITDDVCPITFVKSRLFVDSKSPGTLITIKVNAGEALINVSSGLTRLGHLVSEPRQVSSDQLYEIDVTIGEPQNFHNRSKF